MRTSRTIVLASLVGAIVPLAAFAQLTTKDSSPREARRQSAFKGLWNAGTESVKSSFFGDAEGKSIRISAFGSSVTGEGPHGRLNLNFFGSMVTGQSGDHSVSLSSMSGWITGRGPHGRVSLTVSGRSIFGQVGDGSVNVTVLGSWATGTFLGKSFSLSGFDNLNPQGVAALLGAL